MSACAIGAARRMRPWAAVPVSSATAIYGARASAKVWSTAAPRPLASTKLPLPRLRATRSGKANASITPVVSSPPPCADCSLLFCKGPLCSPPPCGVRGERSSLSRSGVGVPRMKTAVVDPPPPPPPRKGGGRRKRRPTSRPISARTARGLFTRSHLRCPALCQAARAAGAGRAVAAELVEPEIEVDAVAAEAALGENSGNFGGFLARAQTMRIHDHPRQPRRQRQGPQTFAFRRDS